MRFTKARVEFKLSELYTERANLEKARGNRPNDLDIKYELFEVEKDIRFYQSLLASKRLIDDTEIMFQGVRF